MVGCVTDGMAKSTGKSLVIPPSLQSLGICGTQVPEIDLPLYWFVATQYVCHFKKWMCKIPSEALVQQASHVSHLRQGMRIALLSAEYGLKTPFYSNTNRTALSDV